MELKRLMEKMEPLVLEVLIVLYGIETKDNVTVYNALGRLNRTLWN